MCQRYGPTAPCDCAQQKQAQQVHAFGAAAMHSLPGTPIGATTCTSCRSDALAAAPRSTASTAFARAPSVRLPTSSSLSIWPAVQSQKSALGKPPGSTGLTGIVPEGGGNTEHQLN